MNKNFPSTHDTDECIIRLATKGLGWMTKLITTTRCTDCKGTGHIDDFKQIVCILYHSTMEPRSHDSSGISIRS